MSTPGVVGGSVRDQRTKITGSIPVTASRRIKCKDSWGEVSLPAVHTREELYCRTIGGKEEKNSLRQCPRKSHVVGTFLISPRSPTLFYGKSQGIGMSVFV
ncbi:hypothetical protein NPIL_375611 [Nephila pilipes]|uniref:Uncharacterized protein n=1 Tax=Nephila pilipes TaxID=299642 RepID=A0A8X6MVJ9_NEPPI|nr:hypothetical protein NPIL_375611 [Nephila pilipes]